MAISLDNNLNPLPFYCHVNRAAYTVAPGDSLHITAEQGIVDVQFARDELGQSARYLFDSEGTYKIGIDKRDGKCALFPSDAVPMK